MLESKRKKNNERNYRRTNEIYPGEDKHDNEGNASCGGHSESAGHYSWKAVGEFCGERRYSEK